MTIIVLWTTIGLVAGYLVKPLMPSDRFAGGYGDLSVGIFGAISGGLLFNVLFAENFGGMIGDVLAPALGAVGMLFVLRYLLPSAFRPQTTK